MVVTFPFENEDITYDDMPFWKQNPNFPTIDPSPYRISREVIEKLQTSWKDVEPAEEIINFLRENK